MLEIKVKKQLGQLPLSANLQIPAQGVTALFGLSGSGKTSLIQLIGGLTKPDEGSISLNGRLLVDTEKNVFVPTNKRHIGYVFQDARLFPHYRVLGNLTYGMKNPDPDKVKDIVELLGIGHLLKRYPITLSGGEKQRVAIGRALLTDPEILLMDEPLSALDLPRKRELLDYLDKLAKNIQIPILYVTHSLDELLRLAEQVVLLDEGKVKAYDLLEKVWHSPEFAPWQDEMEKSSVLALTVDPKNDVADTTALAIGNGQHLWIPKLKESLGTKEKVRVCIYSSDVAISLQPLQQTSIRNNLCAEIMALEENGQQENVHVQLKVGASILWSTITYWAFKELQLQQGQKVYLQIKTVSVVR